MSKLKDGGVLSISLPTDPGLLFPTNNEIEPVYSGATQTATNFTSSES